MSGGGPNWANRTIFTADNLDVLRGMNSGSARLAYLDPPFNSNRQYSAPVGSKAAGAAFKDSWTLDDVKEAEHGLLADQCEAAYETIRAAGLVHSAGMRAYLIMMAVRLLELRRVLADDGSIYLHCDDTADSYLRLLMDAVFGHNMFRNEIIWSYRRWPSKQRNFQRMHDVLLRYSAGPKPIWNQLYEPPSDSFLKRFKGRANVLDPGATKKRAAEHDTPGLPMRDVWDISIIAPASRERTGYPTQKPLALLERIIRSSSAPDDMVIDPFCGCATTCVAAERLGRRWVGIDLSPMAVKLVEERLKRERKSLDLMPDLTALTEPPRRTDTGPVPHYRTHRNTLYGRQEGDCAACRVHFPIRNLTVDHVIPRSKGGGDHIENLQLLCGACNSLKGAGTQAALLARLRERGIGQ